MAGVQCDFWEFGAVIRHEKLRRDAGIVDAAEQGRKFAVPSFLTWRNRGLEQPDDPAATLAEAEESIRDKGWVDPVGPLNDQWYEIVTALVQGSTFGYLYVNHPEKPETRALIAVNHGLAFRVVLHEERVWIEEIHPDVAWPALVACLPNSAPADGRGIVVPFEALAAAGKEAERHNGDQSAWIAYELGQHGVSPEDAYAVSDLATLGDRTTGHFNVGIREWDGTVHFAPFPVNIHHTSTGRVARIPEPPDGDQMFITPARDELIAEALREFHEDLRLRVAEEHENRRSERLGPRG